MMVEKADASNDYDLINPDDFKSYKIEIVVKNPETDGRVSSNKGEVQVCEFREKGWRMEVPSGFCKRGRSLSVLLELIGAPERIKIKATVLVKKVERTDSLNYEKGRKGLGYKKGGPDTVEVRLEEYDEGQWQSFCDAFVNRQAAIENFFDEVKG